MPKLVVEMESMVWRLDRWKARPGREVELEEACKLGLCATSSPNGKPAELFDEVAVSVYDEIGAPKVGVDPEADAWLADALARGLALLAARSEWEGRLGPEGVRKDAALSLAWWSGMALRGPGGFHGMPVLEMAKERGGFAPMLIWASVDFVLPRSLSGKIPAEVVDEIGDRCTAAKAVDLGARLEVVAKERGCAVCEAAARWLIFWGRRGFGFCVSCQRQECRRREASSSDN